MVGHWLDPMALRHKLIAQAVHCEEVYRVRGIPLQFLSQLQHVVVYRPCAGVVLVPPDFIEQFISRDHAFGILRQELQRLEFLSSNYNLLTGPSNLRL